MVIQIQNNQRKQKINSRIIRKITKRVLEYFKKENHEVSIVFTTDETIEKFNSEYLKRNYPTDVIAFPMKEGEYCNVNPFLLGDVLISTETAIKNAQKSKVSVDQELYHLLIHGLLHLLGFDHEKDKKSAVIMRGYERILLREIK